MYLILMWLSFATALLAGFYYYMATTDGLNAFLHPFVMLLIIGSAVLIPRTGKRVSYFQRYTQGLNAILLSVTLIVLIVHIATLIFHMGYAIDLLLIVPVSVGAVFMVMGNYLQRFKLPNDVSYSRVWNQKLRPFARIFVIGGAMMIMTVFFPAMMMLFFVILTVVISVLVTSLFSGIKSA